LSDVITLKVSKRKLYTIIIASIVILALIAGAGFIYQYFTSPKLTVLSFKVVNRPELSYYKGARDWATYYELEYTFANEGWGTAHSVKVVGALYDSKGVVVKWTEDYGDVPPHVEITGSIPIVVHSSMNLIPPAYFKVLVYQGDVIVAEATLPY
jgi:hypothetical protein